MKVSDKAANALAKSTLHEQSEGTEKREEIGIVSHCAAVRADVRDDTIFVA